MDGKSGERAIIISALVVAAIYFYRRATEGVSSTASKVASVAGSGPPAPLGVFVTAWGFTFFVISIVGAASPQAGGSFAILVATADALANTKSVTDHILSAEKASPATSSPATAPAPASPTSSGGQG